MNRLTLHTEYDCQNTIVSNIFIDKYMASANGEFVKIYLYLLRCVTDQQTTISVSALADFFNQTEADVCRALRYWDKQNVIQLSFDPSGKEITDITFRDISDLADSDNQLSPSEEQTSFTDSLFSPSESHTDIDTSRLSKSVSLSGRSNTVDFAAAANKRFTPIHVDAGTAYTPRQITALENSSEDFSMMLYCIRTVLGGKLSTTDISTLAYFYDTLHFSADLIEYLIEYCATNGHTSFRYIEKVALNWAENGITTVKEAKAYSMNYNEATYSVLEAFGITNRAPGKIELDYINKWSDEYHLSTDIILEACNRTIKTTHQPSFEYADSILTRWKKADVKTPDDIKALDAEFEQSQQEKRSLKDSKTSQKNNSSVATNRFNNFQQHNYDMDSLEKALLSKNG